MTEPEAKNLAGELKGLMPMLTVEQGRAVKESLMQRESIDDCLNAIRAYATDYEQFALATFIDRLPPRPGEDQPAWDQLAYLKNREERQVIERRQLADLALCDELSDADFERIAREQIALFDADVRALYERRKVDALRRSKYLASLVAEHIRVNGQTESWRRYESASVWRG